MPDSPPPAQPEPVPSMAALVASFFRESDEADDLAETRAEADLEKAKTTWANGWAKGVVGLAADRAARAAGEANP